ncbi:hypothetical protein AVEN_102983-1 [Araneus ventricosus]|uniref:Uncharacterized protein n=1 Tax=Araneus ventricosus TaxID=182803 RepID=A0A4Y2BAE4_ARAVE|nr:hypothetical protein AVEN_102983-1 [Araneus ventricosus]
MMCRESHQIRLSNQASGCNGALLEYRMPIASSTLKETGRRACMLELPMLRRFWIQQGRTYREFTERLCSPNFMITVERSTTHGNLIL